MGKTVLLETFKPRAEQKGWLWASADLSESASISEAALAGRILADHAGKEQFPLSVLLDVFQSIQRKGIPFILVLEGLPTLFPKLVDARTYAERMFRTMLLTKLSEGESREAILRPIEVAECPVKLSSDSVERIIHESAGYPYFIQFIGREVYDVFIRQHANDEKRFVPVEAIQRKLVGRRASEKPRRRIHDRRTDREGAVALAQGVLR